MRDKSFILSRMFCVVGAHTDCYVCHKSTPVFAIGVAECTSTDPYQFGIDEDDSSAILIGIQDLNYPVIEVLHHKFSTSFKLDTCFTQGRQYWMNHCAHCDSKLGDHYLHSEPDVAFFPTNEEGQTRLSYAWFSFPLRAVALLSAGSTSSYMASTLTLGD